MGQQRLRSGYTTGACAAAAAKAALQLILAQQASGTDEAPAPDSSSTTVSTTTVSIPFPDGSRHSFTVHRQGLEPQAWASTIKDAGDDPDVTNGAEIGVELCWIDGEPGTVHFAQGRGVGRVTRPGLVLPVGEPAINPVPRKMIRAALDEVLAPEQRPALQVRVFVEDGEQLATKTINHRLGIVEGLSILGTTGIVRPISAEAWTETIEASLRVARAAGLDEVVLSTGRHSEAAVQQLLNFPEQGLIMMGDYLHYALAACGRLGVRRIHLAAMWAKMVKAAREVPQTHVRNGALDVADAVALLGRLGLPAVHQEALRQANTAWQIYEELVAQGHWDLVRAVAEQARRVATAWSGCQVRIYLVTTAEGVILQQGNEDELH